MCAYGGWLRCGTLDEYIEQKPGFVATASGLYIDSKVAIIGIVAIGGCIYFVLELCVIVCAAVTMVKPADDGDDDDIVHMSSEPPRWH